MNKTILVPTDFSNNSLIATRYAMTLAKKIDANVHILHAYRPFTSAFQSPLANETDIQRAKLNAEKGLAEFQEKLSTDSGTAVTSSININSVLGAVMHYIENSNICLVVMGAHGASGRRGELLGSKTYDVAKDVSRPLLIVPEHTQSYKLEQTVFFSDYQQGDIKTLTDWNTLYGNENVPCTLVHLHEGKSAPTESDQQKLEKWKAILEKETSLENLSAKLIHIPENLDHVNGILKQLNADVMLLTLVDSRGFVERLLHKSLAKAIVLNPQTPVLLTSEDTQ